MYVLVVYHTLQIHQNHYELFIKPTNRGFRYRSRDFDKLTLGLRRMALATQVNLIRLRVGNNPNEVIVHVSMRSNLILFRN